MRISDWSSDVCSSDLFNNPDASHKSVTRKYCLLEFVMPLKRCDRIKEDLASILQPVDQREAKQPVRDECREAHRPSKLVVPMHVKQVAGNAGELHDMRRGNHESWREIFKERKSSVTGKRVADHEDLGGGR